MKQYIAKIHTSVFPFGLIAKGETLKPEHVQALGAETVEDMVRRGTLEAVNGGESLTAEEIKPQAEAPKTAETENPETVKANPEETEEELPELGDAADLVSEEAEEPKPAKKKTGGRRK